MLALYVTHEAEKRGVTIQYAKMPVDSNSAFGETMLSVVRAFDRLHARLSAEKGRGGLVANIEQRVPRWRPRPLRLPAQARRRPAACAAAPRSRSRRSSSTRWPGRQGEGLPRSASRRRAAA
jgi:DNA invertase Pin-like site-specific DNA recombinase